MRLLTIGSFDTLHPGHLELIAGCRMIVGARGKVLVGVNRDEFIVRYKRRAPIQPLALRLEVLAALRDVDDVFVNLGDEDARVIIDVVRPDALAIGDDWLDPGHDERRYFKQLGVTPDWMMARGLGVHYIARSRGISSSSLRPAE